MKKLYWMLLSVLLGVAAACSDDEMQQISCAIQVPSDGATIKVIYDEKVFIRGYGKADFGSIASAELKVNGTVMPEVTTVPFYVGYALPEGQEDGELKLELAVRGTSGTVATAVSTVRLQVEFGPGRPIAGTMTDARDNREYATVQLGDQVWMAENLCYMPQQDMDVSTTEPKYYVMFDYDASTELGQGILQTYGAYYNHPAAMQGAAPLDINSTESAQGVCPDGWHIPSIMEWRKLAQYVVDARLTAMIDGVRDENAVAKALASTEMWTLPPDLADAPKTTWVGVDLEKNNATGFNGLPTGFRAGAGDDPWFDPTYSCGWWSSTRGVVGSNFVMPTRMYATEELFRTNVEFSPSVGLPVRCVKDEPAE